MALLAAVFTAAPLPSSSTPVALAAGDDAPIPAKTADIIIAMGTSGSIAANAPLAATITTSNPASTTVPAGQMTLELNRSALPDSTSMHSWLANGTNSGGFTTVFTEETPAVGGGNTEKHAVFVEKDALGTLGPGVYPVKVTRAPKDGEGTTLHTRSVLVVTAETKPAVTVLVPLTATPESGTLLSRDELAALTGPGGALRTQLDALSGSSAVLAVDPALVASIRVLGNAAPSSAQDWLLELEALPNERFLLQFGDADATVQADAELPELLQPTTLDIYVDPKNFEPTQAPQPTATPSPTPSAQTVPTLAELTALNGADTTVLWPDAEAVSATTLERFGAWEAEATVLPASAAPGTTVTRADAAGMRLLLTNDAVTAAANAAIASDGASRGPLLSTVAAELAFAAPSTGGQPILVGLDRDGTRSGTALTEVLTALNVSAGTPATRWEELIATSAPEVILSEPSASDRAAILGTLLAGERSLGEFASILDDPQLLLAPERIAILRLLHVGQDVGQFRETTDQHRIDTLETLNAVRIQPASDIQLISAAAPLPVWVRNDLPWPVNVRLTAQPSDSRLDVTRVTDATAQPGGNTRIPVPVEARVGSGSLSVQYTLTSPTGMQLGIPQVAGVTVRAEWENIGLGILGSVVVLLLGFGILRTVLRRRRERTERDDEAGAHESDPDTVASPTMKAEL